MYFIVCLLEERFDTFWVVTLGERVRDNRTRKKSFLKDPKVVLFLLYKIDLYEHNKNRIKKCDYDSSNRHASRKVLRFYIKFWFIKKKLNNYKIKVNKSNKFSYQVWLMQGSFIWELWYHHCALTLKITQNADFFQTTLFGECTSMAVKNNLRVTINLCEK